MEEGSNVGFNGVLCSVVVVWLAVVGAVVDDFLLQGPEGMV